MRKNTYRELFNIGAINGHKCTKTEFDAAPEELRYQQDDDGRFILFDEVDEKDAKLFLLTKQTKDIHTIRNIILTYFVVSILAVIFFVLTYLNS